MPGPKITSLLKEHRERAHLSQVALAERVGVTRQALIAIEAGRQVPSTALSLQLARALGCSVDDLFQLAGSEDLDVRLAPGPGRRTGRTGRVAIGRPGGRWVAHRLPDDAHEAADGLIVGEATNGRAMVEPLADPVDLERNVLLAGCAPLLGVLARRAGRRYRDAPMTWLPAGSLRALELLADGMVHVAGLHLVDERTGDSTPWLRRHLPGRALLVVNLTRWRQGLVVGRGNPLAIHEVGDLLRSDVRVARREKGSGAHALLRRTIAGLGKRRAMPSGGPLASGHAEVAQLVRHGAADVGVAFEGAAVAAGLDFIPLSEERFDLVVPREQSADGPTSRVLDLLGERWFRTEAARMPGYDGSTTGEITTLAPA